MINKRLLLGTVAAAGISLAASANFASAADSGYGSRWSGIYFGVGAGGQASMSDVNASGYHVFEGSGGVDVTTSGGFAGFVSDQSW
jgi:hypothetical protein